MDHEGKEVEITLDADKVRMMDRLDMQKQQFETVIDTLASDVKAAKLIADYEGKHKNAECVNGIADRIAEAVRTGDDFNMREKVFGFVPTEYYMLGKFSDELASFYKLWNMCADFHNSKEEWLEGEFKDLDGAKIEEEV